MKFRSLLAEVDKVDKTEIALRRGRKSGHWRRQPAVTGAKQ
jgi:hypothetical protein